MREQIANDRVLVQLLRQALPHYQGEAVELFRGENRKRWKSQAIGLAWTKDIETARMFGRGLNAIGSGGVLLKAHFEREAIISGPSVHSQYLGENQFTIDPFYVNAFTAIEFFPAIT